MMLIGFSYFLFLYIDIRRHIGKATKALRDREKRQELYEEQLAKAAEQFENGTLQLTEMENGRMQVQIPLPEFNEPIVAPVSHKYCFVTGRHGEIFYLKLGAAWFCFGLLINYILIISYQIIFLTSTDDNFYECVQPLQLAFDIMFPLYSLFLLFVIFKYANVIINENRGLARLAIMHAIGTSLAFWIFTIVRETSDAIRLKYYDEEYDEEDEDNGGAVEALLRSSNRTTRATDVSTDICDTAAMNVIYSNFSPYLYPFIIEFCILIGKSYS